MPGQEFTGNAFVTGGASGISKAVCVALARRGVRGLVIADINLDLAMKAAAECKAVAINPEFRVEAYQLDVSDPESVQNAIDRMAETFGRIDYVVNGAAVLGEYNEVSETGLDTLRRTFDVNVQGSFLVIKAATKVMAAQKPIVIDEALPARGVSRGVIVNIGSVVGLIGLPKIVQCVASKHAVIGLTKTAAIDNIKHNIRVNCVSPSWVDTPVVQSAIKGVPTLEKVISSHMPMGRMGIPEEIADVVLFLCSPSSSWVNGTNFVVDGAMTVGPCSPDM
ncbi:NAD(P)-binding protein [Daldinia caldariorum]|uniref:NAD(P)-binding protein n=1 Tax=Daldinia caldariorum TaxID=326644 RepID=UPI0020080543|nr:NAD(P)-binding protein [Daldinia caldariorum]KAI1467638.1 NAD(P)-binding protein [Daldinia caldariorum]